MTYLNPLSILDLPQKNPLQVEQAGFLKQEKKRLLAEFELADGPTLQLAGQEVDRATVLKLFEQLEDPVVRAYHIQVYQLPHLKAFLETQSLQYFSSDEIEKFSTYERAFLKWVGPYFATSYNSQLLAKFKQRDWEALRLICRNELPIPPAYQATSFKDTYRLIHLYVEEIQQLIQELRGGTPPSGKVQELTDELLIDSLNQLPPYFHSLRETYAGALEDLGLVLYNEQKRFTLAAFVLKQALKLQIGPDATGRIQDLLAQMETQPTPLFDFSGGGGQKKQLPYVWAGVGTIAIILLFFLL